MEVKDTDIEMKTPTPEQIQNPRANKIATLQKSLTTLQSQIDSTQAELEEILPKLRENPTTTVKKHINLLHTYNEVKDIAQGLMGLLAESRGERIGEVSRGFGISEKD